MAVHAAEFQSGQAAWAVIGQTSFSASESGLDASAMSLASGKLYVADGSSRLLTFDLAKLPRTKDDVANGQATGCAFCVVSPEATVAQSVFPGIAAVSLFENTLVIADPANHRVSIWLDANAPLSGPNPDVVLGGSSDTTSVSATSLVEPVAVAFDGKHLFVGDAALHRVLVWNGIPQSDDRPADVVLGQSSFSSGYEVDTIGADTIGEPSALVSDGTNLFVADRGAHRILVFSPGDIPLNAKSILNSASMFPGPLAPGTLVTITGSNFSERSDSISDDELQPLPKKLAGVQVFFNGMPLPLFSASATELRSQIPYDFSSASSASLYIRTEHADGTVTVTNAVPVRLTAAAPGLYAFAGREPRSGIVLHASNSPERDGVPVTAENPARAGETLTLWATGMGSVAIESGMPSPQQGVPFGGVDASLIGRMQALVDGQPVGILSAVLPHNAIGIYLVKIELPAALRKGVLQAHVQLIADGRSSNVVTFPVRGNAL